MARGQSQSRAPQGVAGYSKRVIGASGVDQAADVPPGTKSPSVQFAPSGTGVYRLQSSAYQQIMVIPCLGFSAFRLSAKAKTVIADPANPPLISATVTVRVYSHSLGLRRLVQQFRISAPYAIPS